MAAEDSRYFLDALAKLAGVISRVLAEHPDAPEHLRMTVMMELPKGIHRSALKNSLTRLEKQQGLSNVWMPKKIDPSLEI